MDGDDLYAVLEVPRTASVDEIRRAYKRLALRWHPDKNPDARDEAERRFKAISRAYEVLSNEQARATYDRYGMAGVEGHAADESERCGSGASAPFTGRRTSPQATFVFQPFVFADPFELFDQLFADAFALDEELAPFFFSQPRLRRAASARVVRDPLSLLLDPSTGGSVFTSFTSSSSTFGGGPGGVSRSVSSTTQIVNGRKVTRTVTRTMQPDGTVHEDVDEKVEDLTRPPSLASDDERGARLIADRGRPAQRERGTGAPALPLLEDPHRRYEPTSGPPSAPPSGSASAAYPRRLGDDFSPLSLGSGVTTRRDAPAPAVQAQPRLQQQPRSQSVEAPRTSRRRFDESLRPPPLQPVAYGSTATTVSQPTAPITAGEETRHPVSPRRRDERRESDGCSCCAIS